MKPTPLSSLSLLFAFALLGAGANAQDAPPFDAVELTYDRASSDGEWEHSVRIERDGKVRLERSQRATKKHEVVEGRATAAELRALADAVLQAELGTVPESLLSGIPSLAPEYFRLVVQASEGPFAGETSGEQGRYGEFADRVGPLVGAALSVAKRVRSEPAEPAPESRAGARPFDRVTLKYDAQDDLGQGSFEREISVDSQGRVQVTPGSAPGTAAAEGQATAKELAALADAVRQARLSEVPSRLPGIPSLAPVYFSVFAESGDKALAGGTSGEIGRYAGFSEQLSPLLAAVLEIGTRVGVAPVVEEVEDAVDEEPEAAVDAPFDSVTLIYQENDAAGAWERTVVVYGSGEVKISEDNPAADVGSPTVGRLTDAELDAVAAAVRGARLSELPQRIPGIPSLNPEPFQIAVGSSDPALAGGTSGELGRFGDFDARLRPMISTIVKIEHRVLKDPQAGLSGALGQ
ncbi:MAG: hypothetical protein KDD82_09645 [Planctomycetes bacterium]|nr:hypothetical protein [Planctomycetota bacterium]